MGNHVLIDGIYTVMDAIQSIGIRRLVATRLLI
jgi:hypothetical protein